MALKAGRVGVNPKYVDNSGRPLVDEAYIYSALERAGIISLYDKKGNPLSIDNAVDGRVYDLIVSMIPKQSGTGTPSPDNVRTISGYNSITVTVNSTDNEITFDSTVYGGTLNVLTGDLVITKDVIDLGSLTWTKETNTGAFWAYATAKKNGSLDIICDSYASLGESFSFANYSRYPDKSIGGNLTNNILYLKDTGYTDAATLKAALNGVYACVVLATAVTDTVTAQTISLSAGSNTVASDTGSEMELKYLGTIVNPATRGNVIASMRSLDREASEDIKEIIEEPEEEKTTTRKKKED